jgi:hypothetical protein
MTKRNSWPVVAAVFAWLSEIDLREGDGEGGSRISEGTWKVEAVVKAGAHKHRLGW